MKGRGLRPLLAGLAMLAMLGGAASTARAQTETDRVSPGAMLTYSNIYSIGLEWDVLNDVDHDATAAIELRVAGAAEWQPAGSLLRVGHNGRNMLAGSVMFLAPDTDDEVKVALSDVDRRSLGGSRDYRTRYSCVVTAW
jgi:hypothetical protein